MQQTKLDDQRYPRWGLLRALRWIFLHWWLTPLACLLILITIYFADQSLHNGLPKFLITFWWAMLLLLIAMTVFLFWAYRRADADETYESSMLRQQPPPSGFKLQHTLSGHTDVIWNVAWSPDGRLLASASHDKTVRLWDAASTSLLHTLTDHTDAVMSVAWSPDGRLLASASRDTTVRLWDAASTSLLHTLTDHTGLVLQW